MIRTIACLDASRRIPEFIAYARGVALGLQRDPRLSGSSPPLAVFEADLRALEEAHTLTLTRAAGTASARDACLDRVRGDLLALCTFVQSVADANPEDAAAIIETAGMNVKRSSGHGKADFEVKRTTVPGTVVLVARAAKGRASYDWQYGKDGVTWLDVESTLRADATIRGLTPGVRYLFRLRVVTAAGKGDWSDAFSLLVT
jgi:hypothetical protein